MPKFIVIRMDGLQAEVDAQGLDLWAVACILQAAYEAIWQELPTPMVRNHL